MKQLGSATSKNLLIVGGADGIGIWLAKRFFADTPEIGRITLADIKPLHASALSDECNPGARHIAELEQINKPIDAVRLENGSDVAEWAAVETAASAPARQLDLGDYNLVMLAVPENQIEHAASSILPQLGNGAAVFDVVSTKRRAIAAMLKHAPEGVEVFGTHPLFGPAVQDVVGQTFAMIPTQRASHEYDWLTALLRSRGAIPEEISAEKHDRYMLLVQTLTHYAYLVFGKTLARAFTSGDTLTESFRLATPPYSVLTAFTSRIIGSNPRVYAQIQGQEGSDELRRLFAEMARELAERFTQGDEEIQVAIKEIVDPFKGSDIVRAYANSVVLTDSVQQGYHDLLQRKQSGELTIVETSNPFSSSDIHLHVGIVAAVDRQRVEIIERQTIAENGKYYLAYDDESKIALKKFGKSARKKKIPIERWKIQRLYTPDETRKWRADHLEHHRRDISAIIDGDLDVEDICSTLMRINDALLSAEVDQVAESEWLGRYGIKNVLFRFTIFGDRDPQACVQDLRTRLAVFGMRTATEK